MRARVSVCACVCAIEAPDRLSVFRFYFHAQSFDQMSVCDHVTCASGSVLMLCPASHVKLWSAAEISGSSCSYSDCSCLLWPGVTQSEELREMLLIRMLRACSSTCCCCV